MGLRVIEPGLHSLIVDAGRPGWRGYGVSLGGAADRGAFHLGNALLGNSPDAAALEITLAGPTLEAIEDVGLVVCGAPFEMWRDDTSLSPGFPFHLKRGERLRIRGTASGVRGYLCVCGGWQTPLIMGSRSAFEPISRGMILPCDRSGPPPLRGLGRVMDATGINTPLRVLAGPQADWFLPGAFIDERYVVSATSNRMGIRLTGRALPRTGREMISEPVAPGTIQITNEGQPIILGVDGQTIGGYPKIAQVITADRDRLAQCRPGETITFTQVTLGEAENAARQARRLAQEWRLRLEVTGSN